MKVVMLTGHYYKSKNRAGFHFIADSLSKMGHEVTFISTPVSIINIVTKSTNITLGDIITDILKTGRQKGPTSKIWITPMHPFKTESSAINFIIGLFSKILYARWPLFSIAKIVKSADLFIFESNHSLCLFERFKNINSRAKYIYRMSDDIDLLKYHNIIHDAERYSIGAFDLVSVPSNYMYKKYKDKGRVRLDSHGIDKSVFDNEEENPYSKAKNAVFVGMSHFDANVLQIFADNFPDWTFHIIGPIDVSFERENIMRYGKMEFSKTVRYIKFADIGLLIRSYSVGAESLSDSLKVLQYSYCNLPTIAPNFLFNGRKNMHYYDISSEESIVSAFNNAINCATSTSDSINSWDDLAESLLNGVKSE